eukprot:scaffold57264_cov29-Tisochrysis_lutea.AAC.3
MDAQSEDSSTETRNFFVKMHQPTGCCLFWARDASVLGKDGASVLRSVLSSPRADDSYCQQPGAGRWGREQSTHTLLYSLHLHPKKVVRNTTRRHEYG